MTEKTKIEVKEILIAYVNGKFETYLLAAESVNEKIIENLKAEKKWLRVEEKYINLANVLYIQVN